MFETVSCCPMCLSTRYHRRFDDIPDFVFGATEERWSIDECDNCGSLFLAERPDESSIGPYYDRYYTHEDEADTTPISGISVKSGTAKKLANSWRNHKYGSSRPSLGAAGVAAALAFPPLRGWIDAECRHLPKRQFNDPPLHVLDVGHGDARFLRFVREIGHVAAGVEIDPKAVAQARVDALDVHQGNIDAALAIWGEGSFDYITMSHVIEHVHDPRRVIAAASRLLRLGGRLWIECPNPKSRGLDHYEARWRDLDPPRHLCIPSLAALEGVAKENGLALEKRHWRPFVPFEVYPFSAKAKGDSARRGYAAAAVAEAANALDRDHREWSTVTFIKTNSN
jgi:SAM-dependent methyltransferase